MKHILPLALLVLPAATACGPIRYVPIDLLNPTVAADSTVSIGDVQVALRAGEEWLEVHLQNRGSTPVAVDWARASFADPAGQVHRLTPVAHLDRSEMMRRDYAMNQEVGDLAAVQRASFDVVRRRALHEQPALLDRVPTVEASILPAGARYVEVLYPAEHVHVEEAGGWNATALFCRSAMRWYRQEPGPFQVRLPVQVDGQWREVTLVARVRPTQRTPQHP